MNSHTVNFIRLLRFFLIGILVLCILSFILPVILILVLVYALFAPGRLHGAMFNIRNSAKNRFYSCNTRQYENSRNDDDVIDVEGHVVGSTPIERMEDRRN